MVYFSNSDQKNSDSLKVENEIEYQTGDLLEIIISSPDPDAVKSFNILGNSDNSGNNSPKRGYAVDKNGMIDFPVVGSFKAGGLNKNELIDSLKLKLTGFVKQPTIQVNLLNFRITVLGDVRRPGTYSSNSEKFSILEALGYAEDLNITAKIDNVLLIRELNGQKIQVRIDLRDQNLLNSPYYYLKQNDVVYVQPGKVKVNNEKFGRSFSAITSIASLIVSTLIFLFVVK